MRNKILKERMLRVENNSTLNILFNGYSKVGSQEIGMLSVGEIIMIFSSSGIHTDLICILFISKSPFLFILRKRIS
jgi:hypothetical protein